MKKLLFIILFLPLLSFAQRTLVPGWNENKVKVLSSNYYLPAMIYLPSDYNTALTKRYPVIFSFSGSGEAGSDTVSILNNGMPKNISNNGSTSYTHEGTAKTVGTDTPTANDKNGNSRTAIVVAVQASSYGVNPSWWPSIFPDVTGRLGLRIDSSMVYLYGYSAGNWAGSGIISNLTGADTIYNKYITAIFINSGATQDLTWTGVGKIADRGIHAFLVAGASDASYFPQMQRERDTLKAHNSSMVLLDSVPGQGHSGFDANALASKTWTKFGSKNIYQALFQYANTNATTWTPSGGGTVVARAGVDQSWNMPKTTATLNGGGSTGSLTSITWRKISSPFPSHTMEGVLSSTNTLVTTVSNFGVGDYAYELSVSDGTTTSKDTVIIHGLPFKSKTPNATHRKILLTPSGGEYYHTNIIASLGQLNGSDTLVLTQSANLFQGYGDDGNGGWGGDSVNQLVIMGATPDVTLRQFRSNGQFLKVMNLTFDNPNASPDIALPAKHYAIEISNCTMNAGDNFIYAKAVVDTTDVLTYGNNWDFKYNYFHHNTINRSNGEGMYLGHTFSDEDKVPQGFGSYTPVKMSNLTVSYNTVKNAGWDGIQTSNAPNVTITHNTIDSTGNACKSAQLNGIILGGYSYGRVDSNDVRNTKSAAIAIFGYDTVKVRGNVIVNGGYADIQTDLNCNSGNPYTAIDVTDNKIASLGTPSPTLVPVITGNCIQQVTSYTGGAAIRIRNSNGTMRAGIVSGNKIGDPLSRSLSNLIFDASGSTVSSNTAGTCSPVNVTPNASAGGDQSITLPVNFVTIDGSSSNDPDGSISSYSWAQVSGPSQATIAQTGIVSTTVANLIPGKYTFRLTVTDNSGATATDDVDITINAVVNVRAKKFKSGYKRL